MARKRCPFCVVTATRLMVSLVFLIVIPACSEDVTSELTEADENGQAEKVTQAVPPAQPGPQREEETQAPELPPYKVLDAVNLLTGGRYGDVLIETLSRETPKEDRESALRRISEKEGFQQAAFYCSDDAYRANNSASFLRTHPGALKTCFLGSLQGGVFTAGEELFP